MAKKKSAKFDMLKEFYDRGLWSAKRLQDAVTKGWITQAEYDEIVGASL